MLENENDFVGEEEVYGLLREYYLDKGKVFSDEFYVEMFAWNKERKRLIEEEALKHTVFTPEKVNAYGQKRKPNGRWNYD